MRSESTLLLKRGEVARLLSLEECTKAVEAAFVQYQEGKSLKPGVLEILTQGGGFHIKAAGLRLGEKNYFAAKVNGNFFDNMKRFSLPLIQGVIVLSDAENGRPLALMDSIEISIIRTGATTAAAAKYLARPDTRVVTICGCGNQGRVHLRALKTVLPVEQAFAYDSDSDQAEKFARELSDELQIEVKAISDLREALRQSDACVTCTPSTKPFLMREDILPGGFIAAVGADNPGKQELDPRLMASAKVVVDILEQCAEIGDLHHALDEGVMTKEDVHAELAEIVTGRKPGRTSREEIIIFDSTGTALQDVAAASIVYEKALATGTGLMFDLAE